MRTNSCDDGLQWRDTPREVAEAADILFTSLPDDGVLEAVASGPDGILAGLAAEKIWVDMSTVSPRASRGLAERVHALGAAMLDAPVSGSVPQVQAGTLTIMVGGDKDAYARVEPLLRELGTPTHIGENGQGLVLKLAINISLAVQMLAFAEGLVLAERSGVDPKLAVDVMTAEPDRLADAEGTRRACPRPAGRGLVRRRPDAERRGARARRRTGAARPAAVRRSGRLELLTVARALGYERRDLAALFEVLAQLAGEPELTGAPSPAARESLRHDWRAAARAWGPPGNERLTASAGLALLILLAVETLTTLSLRSYLPVHIFLGLLLLPPLALKLASTGWRFLRYYTGNKPYRLEGPPQLLLRLLAPLLVASTLSLFGSGVALIVAGHGGGTLLTLHAVSFGVWGVVMIVHVLAYLARTLRLGSADWRPHADPIVAGARSRRAALGGSLLAGVIVASATYPVQQAWLSHRREHRHDDRRGAGSAQLRRP